METTGILQHMMVYCMATVLQYYIDGLPQRSAGENFHFVFSTAAAAAAALSPTAATIATTAATNIPHTSRKGCLDTRSLSSKQRQHVSCNVAMLSFCRSLAWAAALSRLA